MVKKKTNPEPSKKHASTMKWAYREESSTVMATETIEDIKKHLLVHRGLLTKIQREEFLHPPDPNGFSLSDVGIDAEALHMATERIIRAIETKESIIVYADYDADGITAGTIMWETLHALGARVMPYIPHRVDEGYGLSKKGIDTIYELYAPTLIVTVDHGITGAEKVQYARTLGIDVIVTDHHTKGDILPDCITVHTTQLCGAGVSRFVSKELRTRCSKKEYFDHDQSESQSTEHLALAAIGTVADLVPLIGPNRSIVKYGLIALNQTQRVGLRTIIEDAGMTVGELSVYNISHGLAPRLNAMGRLEHAMDALRLLCTKQADRAMLLSRKMTLTNKDRQQLTIDSASHAKEIVRMRIGDSGLKHLLFVADESYNQGIIGLIAGKLVEEFYRPSIVLSKGEHISKASARSISGFNIVEAIRLQHDLLIDVGGHPMAAGFTIETKNLTELQSRLETLAQEQLTDEQLVKSLHIEQDLPLASVTETVWEMLQEFEPFGFGNMEPIFSSCNIVVNDIRLIGKDKKHLKLRISTSDTQRPIDAVAFNMADFYELLQSNTPVDIAYTIDMNVWNGQSSLQLKIKDIRIRS